MTDNSAMTRLRLRQMLAKSRRDMAVFAALTVVLTPFFCIIAVCVLFLMLSILDLHLVPIRREMTFLDGVNGALVLMILSFFLQPGILRRQEIRDWLWIGMSLITVAVLLLFAYATPYEQDMPVFFWLCYTVLAFYALGCMGYVYEPKDQYYLGWSKAYIVDDPFTLEDDLDRAHVALGFATAVPGLILSSYADVFGSTWLWRGLDEREVAAAVSFLQTLAAGDAHHAVAGARILGDASAVRIMRALKRLDLIVIDKAGPRLSLNGRDFLAPGNN